MILPGCEPDTIRRDNPAPLELGRREEGRMLFLVWYDPNTAHTVAEKIQAAIAAYSKRFAAPPNLVLVSGTDTAVLDGIEVRSARTVQPHHYWVGRSDDPSAISILDQEGPSLKSSEQTAD
jgi:hypothetical protein